MNTPPAKGNPICRPEQIVPQRPCDRKPRAPRGTGAHARRKRQRLAAMLAEEAAKWPPCQHITVIGEPVGKPRMTRRDKWLKPPRPCVAAYRQWADDARASAGRVPPAAVITQITVTAWFKIPASRTDVLPGDVYRQKPDGDNILKSVCDALWKSDEALGGMAVYRYWTDGESMTEVEVRVAGGVWPPLAPAAHAIAFAAPGMARETGATAYAPESQPEASATKR